ncbi:hypothetical protein AT575_06920 [Streptococcus penaeicida]|uniref:Uncharacterized protein n=1 Tax=Streptococcus penaeicida TaxID=1765960 RepID=A0A2N8LB97_9STRE|nr:hypothetical protein AT575_06920 [Streptococcus penaeicida]
MTLKAIGMLKLFKNSQQGEVNFTEDRQIKFSSPQIFKTVTGVGAILGGVALTQTVGADEITSLPVTSETALDNTTQADSTVVVSTTESTSTIVSESATEVVSQSQSDSLVSTSEVASTSALSTISESTIASESTSNSVQSTSVKASNTTVNRFATVKLAAVGSGADLSSSISNLILNLTDGQTYNMDQAPGGNFTFDFQKSYSYTW